MLDLLFVVTGVVFFVVAILYIYGCDWFIKERETIDQEHIETNRERVEAA